MGFIAQNSIGIGTTSTTGIYAGINTEAGTIAFDYTDGTIKAYNGAAWRDIAVVGNGGALVNATGGTITELPNPVSGTDRLHSFFSTSSSPTTGTFSITDVSPFGPGTASVLIVGAGGNAGSNSGGGGGGLYIAGAYPLSPGNYPVIAGGQSGTGTTGDDSVFAGLTAGGGGNGGPPGGGGNGGRPAGGNGGGAGGVWGTGGASGGSGHPISPSGQFTGYGGNSGGANAPGGSPNGWGGGGGGASGGGGNASGGGPGGLGGAGSSGTQATGAMRRNGSGNGGYYGGPQGGGAQGGYSGSPGGVYIRYKWKN